MEKIRVRSRWSIGSKTEVTATIGIATVLPKDKELHKNMGHVGSKEVAELARERLFWPPKILVAVLNNEPRQTHAPLQTITTYAPLDFLGLPYEYILVIVDHLDILPWHIQPGIKRLAPQQYNDYSQIGFYMAKDGSSRINSSTS